MRNIANDIDIIVFQIITTHLKIMDINSHGIYVVILTIIEEKKYHQEQSQEHTRQHNFTVTRDFQILLNLTVVHVADSMCSILKAVCWYTFFWLCAVDLDIKVARKSTCRQKSWTTFYVFTIMRTCWWLLAYSNQNISQKIRWNVYNRSQLSFRSCK